MEKFQIWYQKYVDVCNQKYNSYLDNLKNSLTIERSSLQKLIEARMHSNLSVKSELDEKIGQKNDKVAEMEENIEKLSSIRQEMDSRIMKLSSNKVYRKLTDHPKIDKVEIKDNELNVITKKLIVKGHNIGHFKFTFDPTTNRLFIRNLEYVVEGALDHWHVKYGDPCLADWKPVLWRYIDTFQIFFFIDTLIHYLLLAQGDRHAYKVFDEWIKLFETKPEIKKTQVNRSELSVDQLAYAQTYGTVVVRANNANITAGWDTGTTYTTVTNTFYYWGTSTTA